MTKPKAITIKIDVQKKTSPLRTLASVAIMVTPIGIGIVTNSAAMQWMGFVLGWLAMAVGVANLARKSSGLSFDEARKYIDELEQDDKEVLK